jgi:hypothetical protein
MWCVFVFAKWLSTFQCKFSPQDQERQAKQVRFVSSFVTTTTITTSWCNETLYVSISTNGSMSTILVIVMGLVTADVHDSTGERRFSDFLFLFFRGIWDFLFLFYRGFWIKTSSFFHHVRDTPSAPHLSSEEQISGAFCYAGTSAFQLNNNENHLKSRQTGSSRLCLL